MKTPTIEEVIEHFKDAEEVECVQNAVKYKIGNDFHLEKANYWVSGNEGKSWVLLYRGREQRYAKITKYKSKYDLSKLTPEIVQELIKEPNIHEMFVRIGVVKIEETYIKIPISEIRATPNDCELGKLVRQIAG
jgi:transposase